MVARHEEVLSAAQLVLICRSQNCNLLAKRKSINLVGSSHASQAH
jgi:hypothetical protein